MKNEKRIITIALGCVYSYLFYDQGTGINYSIFTLLFLSGLIATKKNLLQNKPFIIIGLSQLILSFCLFFNQQGITLITFHLLTFITVSLAQESKISNFTALAKGIISLIVGGLIHIIESSTKKDKKTTTNTKWVLPTIITLVISLIFYSIYSSSNPVLSWVTSQIDLSFINFGFIAFTFLCVLISFGAFNTVSLLDLESIDINSSNILTRTRNKVKSGIKGLFLEKRIGVYLLIGLSVTLLYVNLVDLVVLLSGILPEGITYAEFLHQGFWSLVVSVLLSIGIVLYFFRNELNFVRNNEKLKTVAYMWMAMNFILVVTTISKNTIYVAEYGLTYKRILVYAFLLLTSGGIIITYIKVYATKSSWYFSRKGFGLALTLFACFSLCPWDKVITVHNLNSTATIDLNYLCTLNNNKSILSKYIEDNPNKFTHDQKVRIDFSLKKQVITQANTGWQSFNYNSIVSTK